MRSSAMWTPQLMRPPPALREVHFWCIFPEEVDGALLKHYEELLSPEELAEVPKARTQKMQTGRILARSLVRTTLARYADGLVDPSSLAFRKNTFGKPEVIWPKLTSKGKLWKPPSLSFNLSHTNSLIACGVTLDSAVGIDVEEKDRRLCSNLMALARRYFSTEEADWLQNFLCPQEQGQNFIRLWTLKEAYAKAVGKGISGVPFQDFTFHLKASLGAHEILEEVMKLPTDPQAMSIELDLAQAVAEQEKPSNRWSFVLFQPSSAHVASICLEDREKGGADGVLNQRPFQVQGWKTVPLAFDECLPEGAIGLGISHDVRCRPKTSC